MINQSTFRSSLAIGLTALAFVLSAFPAQAIPVVKNPSFEDATSPFTTPIFGSFNFEIPVGAQTQLKDWTVTGTPQAMGFLDCLVFPGDATVHVCGGGFALWKDPGLSPDGGNHIAFDGDSSIAHSIAQDIHDLIPGQLYKVSLLQAAAQLDDRTGDTTEWWDVSLGTEHHDTAVMHNLSKDIVPWNFQTLTFQVPLTSTGTETLRFLARGTPDGLPPFVLLDGISITAVPEPGTIALLGIGLLGVFVRRRSKQLA
ncbi:MAG: PEP-CTERM sorting domain-containing protein [Pseudomonadota bacterium]